MEHKLKTDRDYFFAIREGIKTFEIRKNDRNFKVNDILVLQETVYSGKQMAAGSPLDYTGRELRLLVTFVMSDYDGVIHPDWVILGFKKLA